MVKSDISPAYRAGAVNLAERFTSNQCCIMCVKENRRGKRTIEGRNYYKKHREKRLLWNHSWKLKSRYGITAEEHAAMWKSKGVCVLSVERQKKRAQRNSSSILFGSRPYNRRA